MKKDRWVWMPHPAHFICSQDCRFHLATYVGGYIVSTVGEYFPDSVVREILAESRKVALVGIGDERRTDYMRKIGFESIGLDRKYETMVFKASPSNEKPDCCPFRVADFSNLDFEGYNEREAAYLGHMRLCAKWARRK